jgi:hypothetical protein
MHIPYARGRVRKEVLYLYVELERQEPGAVNYGPRLRDYICILAAMSLGPAILIG